MRQIHTLAILLVFILLVLPLATIWAWQRLKIWFARRYCLAYWDMDTARRGVVGGG